MPESININSMNGDYHNYRCDLEYIKENQRSIYCESRLYGDVYRIEKKTSAVFCNGKKIADTSEYTVL